MSRIQISDLRNEIRWCDFTLKHVPPVFITRSTSDTKYLRLHFDDIDKAGIKKKKKKSTRSLIKTVLCWFIGKISVVNLQNKLFIADIFKS